MELRNNNLQNTWSQLNLRYDRLLRQRVLPASAPEVIAAGIELKELKGLTTGLTSVRMSKPTFHALGTRLNAVMATLDEYDPPQKGDSE